MNLGSTYASSSCYPSYGQTGYGCLTAGYPSTAASYAGSYMGQDSLGAYGSLGLGTDTLGLKTDAR